MQIPIRESWVGAYQFGTLLFDLAADPRQEHPIHDPEIEARMCRLLVQLMQENDAPEEQFARLGLCRTVAVA